MTLAAPTVRHAGEVVPPGRLYLAADPTFLRLKDPSGGFDVQFVMMPYPNPTHYLKGDGAPKYASPDEKTRLLVAAFEEALRDIRKHPAFDPDAPAVLGAHVHVFGSVVGPSLFRISPDEDVVVGESFHDQFDYVALGHIHKPQAVGGRTHVRYCGSIERMDLGEQLDAKGVVLFEIGPEGLVGEPVTLPMPSTPVYEVSVLTPAEDLPRLRAEYPDAGQDLVNLHIRYTAGVDSLEEVLKELEQIFPRWYARDWIETGALGPTLSGDAPDHTKSFAETVRGYLRQELTNHADEDRDALLAIADELIEKCE
jgi:exonuclease SbcD